jgi:hypothetical protein
MALWVLHYFLLLGFVCKKITPSFSYDLLILFVTNWFDFHSFYKHL